MANYTLLYDGQCVICRHFVDLYIKPYLSNELQINSFQNAEFEQTYPKEKLAKCKEEVVLVEEKEKLFISGHKAIFKVLEITKQLPLLRFFLNIPVLSPFNWFIYKMVAWHRYSWMIVPPHLRCIECELKIPIAWNIAFFMSLGSLIFFTSFCNIYLWLNSLQHVAIQLFKIIDKEVLELTLLTTALSSIIYIAIRLISFGTYKKVLGLNKVEVVKQSFISSSIASLSTNAILFTLTIMNVGVNLSKALHVNSQSFTLIIFTSILIFSVFLDRLATFRKFTSIGFSQLFSIPLLTLEGLFAFLTPFIVLYFA
ncbi:MAG: DCC1-like thiol-disulfide oxidoreductase family protein [Candidatus Caenarcaniphilales bacterium]|nr:DCC1-like thiol-disulfide oxidoreductase family protein [Candidatus Caenarcaniphilales bacterium]